MPKSNSQQKRTPDACICHQQVGAERRGAGGIAQGEDRAECPEGNLRDITWDGNLNCGIAKEREKINRRKALIKHTVGLFAEQRMDWAFPEKS